MIYQILSVILLIEITVCFYNYLTFGLHMLQLSSYHNPTLGLYEENHKRYIYAPYKVFLLIPAMCALAPNRWWLLLIALPIGLWFVWISKPLPAKKPFVVTARIKRLYGVATVIYLLTVGGALWFMWPQCSLVMALIGGLCIFVFPFIALCNLLNKPVEKVVANYYLHDAQRILQGSNMTVIGITGSFGKTSTKYFLNSILSGRFQSIMTPASYNTTMGVVRTIRENLRPTHTHFVVEMGARHRGEIKEICDLVNPNMGIITSIGEQHLETFGTVQTIVETKMELADAVKKSGTIFLNIDSDLVYENIPHQKVITYGINRPSDYQAVDLTVNEFGISFTVKNGSGQTQQFTTKLLGTHNVVNILGAVAVANTLGMPMSQMVVPVACLAAVPHRLELKPAGDSIIIDDAYNSNPVGAKAAIDALNLCNGMKIIVTPGMVELGEREYECNKTFGSQIAAVCDYVCLVGKKDHIYNGLMESGYDEAKIFRTLDVREAINHALALANTSEGKKYILLENDLPDNY